MISFSKESLRDCWDDVMALAKLHWKETEAYQAYDFKPDKARYLHFNDIGYHIQYMARDEEGRALGHLGCFVTSSLHTQAKVANEDTWFIHPDVRGGRTAKRFYEFVESDLKSLDVLEIRMHSKFANNSERLMRHLGFMPVATLCVKVI